MELIRGVHNLRSRHRGCVATIGNYDGVHLGHRAVLDALIQVGRQRHLPTAAIAFEPTPQEFFGADQAPARLTRFREKFLALAYISDQGALILKESWQSQFGGQEKSAVWAHDIHSGENHRLSGTQNLGASVVYTEY